jgi:hypothetical protein
MAMKQTFFPSALKADKQLVGRTTKVIKAGVIRNV